MEFTCHPSFAGNTELVCNVCPEIPSKVGNQIPFFLMKGWNQAGRNISLL